MAIGMDTYAANGSGQTESAANGTQLEGVRLKVFLDRYSLKDRGGKPVEHYPEQMWRRVAHAIAGVEKTPELRAHWEAQFYEALRDFRFVPGGRILTGAGSGHEVTFYNCFQGDTPVHTREGIVAIGSLSGYHDVLSEGGVYRPAFFQSYGHQRLWEVTLSNGAVFHATGDHQWVASRPKGGTERVPTRELRGRHIPINARPSPAYNAEFADGVRHGIVYGDGSTQYGQTHGCLFGESELLSSWFNDYSVREAGGTVATKAHVRVQRLPAMWKQLPRADAAPSYWRGFVAGLIAADGHVDARGSVVLHNKDAAALTQIAEGMASAGLVASSITLVRATSPFDGGDKPLYCLRFFKETIKTEDLLLPSHRVNFERSPRARHATIQVIDVRETERVEEVFCCVEPETHTITIGHGYLTGQCYVIPSPEDSRGGILDNLKILTEIMARGGGVGVNLSTLRPRGSYIKTVNGTASGPVSWAELYSVITGDVIQQGGSRRGALMVMLDDDHPDVREFIQAKKIDPLTNRPVAIEHANISVAVSDAFMQAVAEDGDWPTQFPTKAMVQADPALAAKVEPGPIFKAREVWRQICESAWASAEPGVVFTDRYNAWNNTWYYQTIRCTNPCFIGSTRLATDRGLLTMEELYREQAALRVVTDVRAAGEAKQVVGGQPLISYGTVMRSATPVFKTREDTPVYRLVTSHGYEVTATPDHRFLTPSGYVELQDLKPGDVLYLQSGPGGWNEDAALPTIAYTGQGASRLKTRGLMGTATPPTTWSRQIGQLLGWLSGDGYVYRHGDHWRLNLLFGRDEASLLPYFQGLLLGWFGVKGVANTRHSTTNLSYEGVPAAFASSLGVQPCKAHEKRVPEAIWKATREAVVGYLQALFTSDGTVNLSCYKKSCSIRLASSSEGLLKDVQLLLLNFGIVSRLYRRREARVHHLPGADRTLQSYETKAQFELVLDKSNRDQFLEEIGFLTSAKQEKGLAYIQSKARPSNRENFITRVDRSELAGCADVYDLTEPTYHSIISNGLVAHQCGEQGISPWSVCNLAALNLSAFVAGPIGAGTFDYAALERAARVGLRFSDNVIDANLYFIKENEEEQLGTRRTGLGTMGLADALITMGLRYGSPEAEAVVERIYRTIRDAAYDESADIAAEKGAFPRFDRERYGQGRFIQTLPVELQAKIARQGIRNAVILTQAPTGTTSLLAGVSSGIEPVFDFAYRRVDRTGESVIYHPLLEAWMQEHPGEERPAYFVGANDLTPEDHIRVQAMVQQYTDSSISKTCNAPNSHTVEEVERLYRLAYEAGCKGVTYYRDGSRDAVLHHIEEKPKAEEKAVAPVAPAVDRTIRRRPAVVHGYTRNTQAPEGKVNITLNSDDEGLLEVFVNVGRAGSDIAALAEALGRLISLMLRLPSPLTPEERAREVASQLRGIGGSRSVGFGLEQVRSLPDAIGLALQKHLEGNTGTETSARHNGHAQQVPLPGLQLTGNLCPECGSTAFVFEEGCKKCHACGHSEC